MRKRKSTLEICGLKKTECRFCRTNRDGQHCGIQAGDRFENLVINMRECPLDRIRGRNKKGLR